MRSFSASIRRDRESRKCRWVSSAIPGSRNGGRLWSPADRGRGFESARRPVNQERREERAGRPPDEVDPGLGGVRRDPGGRPGKLRVERGEEIVGHTYCEA